MSTINSITVGGVVSEVRPSQNPNGPTRLTVQTPFVKNDGSQSYRFTTFELFGNASAYSVGAAVLINGSYRQSSGKDQNGNARDFRSLIANRIQFTGSRENPVIFPIAEAEISGNISSDVKLISNGGAKYSVALNSYKKPEQPNGQPTVVTSFVSVTDFTGNSNGLTKGQPVYLKGMFNHNSFTNDNGEKIYTIEFIVTSVVTTIPAFEPQARQQAPQQNTQGQSQMAPQQTMQSQPQSAPQQTMQSQPQASLPDGFMNVNEDLDSFFASWN